MNMPFRAARRAGIAFRQKGMLTRFGITPSGTEQGREEKGRHRMPVGKKEEDHDCETNHTQGMPSG